MDDNKFWGKPCRHGHINDEGLTLRYIKLKRCVECDRIHIRRYQRDNPDYKEYQAAYHKKLREEKPYKLKEYYETQVQHGNRPETKKKRKPD